MNEEVAATEALRHGHSHKLTHFQIFTFSNFHINIEQGIMSVELKPKQNFQIDSFSHFQIISFLNTVKTPCSPFPKFNYFEILVCRSRKTHH